MPSLLRSKPKDALGGVIEPDKIYSSFTSFASLTPEVHYHANPEQKYRGDSEIVQRFPGQFVPEETDDATVKRLRLAKVVAQPEPEPAPPRPARIPVERRWVITDAIFLGSGERLPGGLELDVDDPRRKAAMPYAKPAIPTE